MSADPTKNVNKKILAFPYDENRKPVAPMLAAIVVNDEINGYLPIKAIDNGDGTATLVSTVNVTLDADVDIGNLHLLNTSDVKIDPATEQKQDAIITAIGGISSPTAGVAEHHNGIATTTPATIAFSGTSKSLLIDNLDASKNLLVSFDAGANTKTVLPGQSLSVEANHASVDVSSSAGTVAFEMLVTV